MSTASPPARRIGRREFLAMLALMMALTALAIDLMLPAFGEIRAGFDLAPDSPATGQIVTVFFIGLAVAQLLYGPISDRFGRKPVLYAGFGLYALGAVGAAAAPSFGMLLASRFLWGVGSAGPRVVSMAIVRDSYRGDEMARTMSLLTAVFILVPVIAPSIGAAIVSVAPWRAVFWFCVAVVAAMAVWVARLPETLDPASRIDLRFDGVRRAARTVVAQRPAMAYALAATALFGAFMSYLASLELIVDDVFGLGSWFPLVFGANAALMGLATLTNAAVVRRFGSAVIARRVIVGYAIGGTVLMAIAIASGGTPSFWAFGPPLAGLLCLHAFMVPNLFALAMEPMGAVAGTASALIGTAQTGVGALLGGVIDAAYDGTVYPLAIGFLGSGLVALAVVRWAGRREAREAALPT
ncbi:MAG: multidrug effflux MFS transporter [Actinobacteria bacterium]|nr:multidrug effflux MFS transporter [Actinomycetota bacterium]